MIKKRAEVAGQHRAAAKVVDAIKADLNAIDRALKLCGYEGDPRGIGPRGKYRQMFGRSELRRIFLQVRREAPADDEAIVDRVIQIKGWSVDAELRTDILKRTRDARATELDRAVSSSTTAGRTKSLSNSIALGSPQRFASGSRFGDEALRAPLKKRIKGNVLMLQIQGPAAANSQKGGKIGRVFGISQKV